jgi:regulator of sirC expression with transglutaminase-like and TPR domain
MSKPTTTGEMPVMNIGDKQGAIADYNHGLNINPNFPQAYKGRGITRSELRDNHGAINDLSRGFETR